MTPARLEVRCCCQPQKLLGWLPVPDRCVVEAGVVCSWILRPELDESVPVRRLVLDEFPVHQRPKVTLRLQIREWEASAFDFVLGKPARLAFYSEDTPLETLRRVRGFVENTECRP